MKKKLVSVLLTAVMATSSLSMASAASMDTAIETYSEENVKTETEAQTEAEPPETETEPETQTQTETETETVHESEPETIPETEPDTQTETSLPETETEGQSESETEESLKQISVKTDKADVFFLSDLKKLKEGTLEDPDLKKDPVPETEADTQEKKDARAAAIKAAEEVLPEDYTKLLTDDSYKLLMKQEHEFQVSEAVDFYVVPEENYEIDNVKATSSVYGELQVTDFENGAYEISMPADNAVMEVKTKEAQDPETESESETESEKQSETEAKEELFLEKADGVDSLDASQFSSQRLVVLASDSDTVIDPEHLIGQYDNIYLLQYTSVEQTMNAYVYYLSKAEAVEPDTAIAAASDETDAETESGTASESETEIQSETETSVPEETEPQEIPSDVTADAIDNPISTLAGEQDSAVVQAESKVIALLDTGAEGSNVIDQVSMIDGGLVGSSTHAGNMVTAITEQNPDAKILSVRVLGDDNLGTISSIVAGMEYAIAQDVDFINLSLYARKSLSNSVLASEIQKAKDAGIEVVGAAGNDGADVINYMPGSVESAWIVGACDEEGNRIDSSNYGATVDYNVVGDSTSVSTARFTGYISKNGTENISSDIIFTAEGESTDKEEVSDKDEDFKAATTPGTLEWGKASIPYTDASTYFTTQYVDSISIVGQNGYKNGYYWADKGVRMIAYLKGVGYTSINGKRTKLDAMLLGTADSLNGFCYHVDGHYLSVSHAGWYDKDKRPAKKKNGVFVEMTLYFYESGNNFQDALSISGTGQFTDIDQYEGIAFVQGVKSVYTPADTWIYKKVFSNGKYEYYTTDHTTGNWNVSEADANRQKIQYTFSASAKYPLMIKYWGGNYSNKRAASFDKDGIQINYHAESGKTWPAGAAVPDSIFLASGANTTQGASSINGNYVNVPGYIFSGWHLSDGTKYNGVTCETINRDLYGYYIRQTGDLTVSKTITGIDQSFIDSIPDANKNFPFTLSGTTASGESYSKDFKVVAGKDVTISDIPEGTYTLTESYGSKWWTCTSTNPQPVTITKGGTATASFTNKIATGNLTIKKKLANIESDAISNEKDKKFKFTLYGTADYRVAVNETKELIGSGSVTFSGIPVGTYTLKESYYDGELWTPSVITQQVTIEKDVSKEVTVTNTFIPERTPQPAPIKSLNTESDETKRLEVKKINKRSDLVTFSIFQQIKASDHEAVAPVKLAVNDALDQAFDYKGYKAYVSANAGTSWTDDTASFTETINGQNVSLYKENNDFSSAEWYRFDITVKVNDDIQLENYIQNIDGTNFYVIPNTASTTFTYKSGTPNEVTQSTNKVQVRMPLDELEITVKKTNEVTGEIIGNAGFTVYEWNGIDYSINRGEMTLQENKTYKMKALHKTDTNQGKFKIVETVTPWGHVGSWSKEVVVGTNATETYTATNPMGMGTITVLKKGKHEEVLAGAVYSIKAKENIVSPQGKVLVTAGTEVDKVTTGNDGTAKSKELYPGKYTVTETNAPLGYAINKTPQDVEVTYKDKDTKVTSASVTFVNDRLYSTITVTKQIDTADIVWEHGNPTFTFKVDGKDVLGNAHTYYKTLEFTRDNVGSGAKASLSAKFTVLAGTYTVSEEKTARYKFGSITDVVNGTISGQTAVLDVSGKKDGTVTEGANGAATFYNVKATDEDLTHTAFVDNTIA